MTGGIKSDLNYLMVLHVIFAPSIEILKTEGEKRTRRTLVLYDDEDINIITSISV